MTGIHRIYFRQHSSPGKFFFFDAVEVEDVVAGVFFWDFFLDLFVLVELFFVEVDFEAFTEVTFFDVVAFDFTVFVVVFFAFEVDFFDFADVFFAFEVDFFDFEDVVFLAATILNLNSEP